MHPKRNTYRFCVLCLFIIVAIPVISNAGGGLFELNNPYWFIELDQAGYADFTYWYPSPRHQYPTAHEMLTGEWAAAIYYDGIGSDPNAMWLTDEFEYPRWYTNSEFTQNWDYSAWNNSANPIWDDPCQPTGPYSRDYSQVNHGNGDTAQSIISDGKLEITIDYEMVDLFTVRDGAYSPLTFHDANNHTGYVKSERYIMLQTYTIKNISGSNITGLEFYQMLHGHFEGIIVIFA
jgi:hypothetical protein